MILWYSSQKISNMNMPHFFGYSMNDMYLMLSWCSDQSLEKVLREKVTAPPPAPAPRESSPSNFDDLAVRIDLAVCVCSSVENLITIGKANISRHYSVWMRIDLASCNCSSVENSITIGKANISRRYTFATFNNINVYGRKSYLLRCDVVRFHSGHRRIRFEHQKLDESSCKR